MSWMTVSSEVPRKIDGRQGRFIYALANSMVPLTFAQFLRLL
jgi:hypothetical protein